MKILAIERLRGVAILMVYLIHVSLYGDAFGVFRPLHFLGTWAGVDLFFVISGFVVTLSLAKLLPVRAARPLSSPVTGAERGALRAFYLRRFYRLAPVAACAIALHVVGAVLGPRISPLTPFLSLREVGLEAALVASGLYNFAAPYLGEPALVYFWSLSVEEQFYLLLPALFVVAGTHRSRVRAAWGVLLIVAVVIRPAFSPNVFSFAHYSSQYRFDAFAAGVLLALGRASVTSVVLRIPALARQALVILCAVALLYFSKHVYVWFAIHHGLVLIWGASAVLVACAAADDGSVFAFPVVKPFLEYLGSRSYAVYVLHSAFLMADATMIQGARGRALALLGSRAGESCRFVVTFLLVLGAAELAHRFVERPAIAAGKRAAFGRPGAFSAEPAE